MKLAVVGSRTFNKRSLLVRVITQLGRPELIISGGARGADALAKQYAIDLDIPYLEFPANWDLYGKSAGYKRNVQIVEACDQVLAFWDGLSKGTEHTVNLAKKLGKKVIIIWDTL